MTRLETNRRAILFQLGYAKYEVCEYCADALKPEQAVYPAYIDFSQLPQAQLASI